MGDIHFKYVHRMIRYEVAETDSGDYYLVDMGVPFLSCFWHLYSFFSPRKCFAISKENAEKLTQQSISLSATILTAGILSTLVIRFIDRSDGMWIMPFEGGAKIVILVVVGGLVLSLWLFLLQQSERKISSFGISLTNDKAKMIQFRPTRFSTLIKQAGAMLLLLTILIASILIVLQPKTSFIFLVIYGISFLCFISYSARSLREGSSFVARNKSEGKL
ncbi:DUF443 family protein [Lacticaseibacillus zeae]|nr:DUF443 family protein [Lacticaseibacillus zeae]